MAAGSDCRRTGDSAEWFMATLPLTHHEILSLVEPFARRGRQVDLAASERAERRVAFRAIEHAGADTPLVETLQLENPYPGSYKLTRTVSGPGGLQARLEASGEDAALLLQRVEAVPPLEHFRGGEGWAIAFSEAIDRDGSRRVTHANAQAGALAFSARVSPVAGIRAELDLHDAGQALVLPQDLVAVIGWGHSPLRRVHDGWKVSVKLPGKGERRSAEARQRLARVAAHLAATLAEPPSRFHATYWRARWGVVARRLIPLVGMLGLVLGALGVAQLELSHNSVFRMLIFHSPPLLLAGLFCLSEQPTVEVPPLPRPLKGEAWTGARPA